MATTRNCHVMRTNDPMSMQQTEVWAPRTLQYSPITIISWK